MSAHTASQEDTINAARQPTGGTEPGNQAPGRCLMGDLAITPGTGGWRRNRASASFSVVQMNAQQMVPSEYWRARAADQRTGQ